MFVLEQIILTHFGIDIAPLKTWANLRIQALKDRETTLRGVFDRYEWSLSTYTVSLQRVCLP